MMRPIKTLASRIRSRITESKFLFDLRFRFPNQIRGLGDSDYPFREVAVGQLHKTMRCVHDQILFRFHFSPPLGTHGFRKALINVLGNDPVRLCPIRDRLHRNSVLPFERAELIERYLAPFVPEFPAEDSGRHYNAPPKVWQSFSTAVLESPCFKLTL